VKAPKSHSGRSREVALRTYAGHLPERLLLKLRNQGRYCLTEKGHLLDEHLLHPTICVLLSHTAQRLTTPRCLGDSSLYLVFPAQGVKRPLGEYPAVWLMI
jgi:hypothetical protein